MVTYTAQNGIRQLDSTEYTATPASGANVRLDGFLSNSGTLTMNSLQLRSSGRIVGNGALILEGGTILASGGSNLIENSISLNDKRGYFFSDGQTFELNGNISGSGGVTLSGFDASLGIGTFRLRDNNSFTGSVSIHNTTVQYTNPSAFGAGSESIAIYNSLLSSDSLGLVTINRPLRLLGGQAAFYQGFSGSNITLAGEISGPGGLTIDANAIITGTNSYEGPTIVSRSLTVNGDAGLGASSQVRLTSSGTIHLTAPWTSARELRIESPNGTFDTNGFDVTINGSLTGLVGSTWTKTGAGRMTINDGTEFRGYTNVNGGTLVLNGTNNGSSYTVNAGGTLAGIGYTPGFVYVSGKLAPGNSAGTLSTGQLTLLSGSTLEIELASAEQYDRVDVTGTVSLWDNVNLSLSLLNGFDPVYGALFTIIENDGADLVTFNNGGRLFFDGNALDEGERFFAQDKEFQISYAGGTGNDVTLVFIPEPSTALFVMCGVLGLARRRRSRT
jgi:autotransporter-associated beta strand protein